jgi:hypothetical protein
MIFDKSLFGFQMFLTGFGLNEKEQKGLEIREAA